MNNQTDRDLVHRLIITPDEELSTEELRKRWKFQAPSANFLLLSFIGCIWGLGELVAREAQTGLAILGGSVMFGALIMAWQSIRVKRLSREDLIKDIKIMREVHSDDDMP